MEEFVRSLVETSYTAIPPEQGDYRKDGLLYCGKCHTPKQGRYELNGTVFTPHILCRCETERLAAVEAAKKRRKWDETVDRLRRDAFSEKMMAEWTFSNDDGSNQRITAAMRRYVDRWDEFYREGKGLLLYGNVGSGKTYAACEIANALIDRGVPCLITNFARLSNTIQGLREKQAYLDSLSHYDLLVIDDLGAERRSEYMQEMVFNIVDARYRSGKPLIVTTNLDMSQISTPENQAYERIYDRLIERCFPVKIAGATRRRQTARGSYADTKVLLGL